MTTSYGRDGSVIIELDRDGIHIAALVHEGVLDVYVQSDRDGWEWNEEAPIEDPKAVQ